MRLKRFAAVHLLIAGASFLYQQSPDPNPAVADVDRRLLRRHGKPGIGPSCGCADRTCVVADGIEVSLAGVATKRRRCPAS